MSRGLSTFVGREHELEVLERGLADARSQLRVIDIAANRAWESRACCTSSANVSARSGGKAERLGDAKNGSSLPVARVEARQMRAVLKAQINKKRQVKGRAGDAEVLADCPRNATNYSYAGPRPEDIDLK